MRRDHGAHRGHSLTPPLRHHPALDFKRRRRVFSAQTALATNWTVTKHSNTGYGGRYHAYRTSLRRCNRHQDNSSRCQGSNIPSAGPACLRRPNGCDGQHRGFDLSHRHGWARPLQLRLCPTCRKSLGAIGRRIRGRLITPRGDRDRHRHRYRCQRRHRNLNIRLDGYRVLPFCRLRESTCESTGGAHSFANDHANVTRPHPLRHKRHQRAHHQFRRSWAHSRREALIRAR